MQAAEARHECRVELEQTQRQLAVAGKEEERASALQARIQHEKSVLKQMKGELVRTLERAAAETRRAEIAEKDLAETKVCLWRIVGVLLSFLLRDFMESRPGEVGVRQGVGGSAKRLD
jgi:hypothetical protein